MLAVEFAAYLMNRCDIDSDGKTPLHRLHGRKDNTPILEFGPPSQQQMEIRNRDSILGVFVGMLSSSAEVMVEQGSAVKTRAVNEQTKQARARHDVKDSLMPRKALAKRRPLK